MASSGKKGKKSKGKTVTLTDFLQETPGVPTLPVKKYNWSDEVEDAFDGYESRPKPAVALPTAPRAARGPDVSEDRIPSQPPYIAYISNLPYDIEEDDILQFFSNMKIDGMRLPKDDRGGEGGKLKGFGYVEFEDRNSLVEAISLLDTNLKGRRIKIDVATSTDNDRRRGRMDIGRDRPERPEVTMGDWRSGPRDTPSSDSRDSRDRGGGGFSRDREGGSGGGAGAPDTNRAGAWRDSMSERPAFRDDDRRDRGGFRDDDRRDRGGFRDDDRRDRGGYRDSDRGSFRDSERGGFRDSDRDRGFSDRGRYGDRDRDRRDDRDGDRRGGYGARRNYDRDDRDRDFKRDDKPPSESDQARSRPKLQLAPRTKPLEEQAPAAVVEPKESTEPVPTPVPAASIFGSAKPVDTAAREREIEERLAKQKDTRPPPRDGSRDNKNRESDEDRGSRKDWGRKRTDDQDDKSPERRPTSRGPLPRKTDDRRVEKKDEERKDDRKGERKEREKAPPKREEKPKEKPARENHEKELPKLKEPEPPNFAASNKFATLEAEISD